MIDVANGDSIRWLYTSEGLGDVVEWINEDEDDSNVHIRATENASPGFGLGLLSVNFNGGTRDSKGRQGTLAERRERLGQVRSSSRSPR